MLKKVCRDIESIDIGRFMSILLKMEHIFSLNKAISYYEGRYRFINFVA